MSKEMKNVSIDEELKNEQLENVAGGDRDIGGGMGGGFGGNGNGQPPSLPKIGEKKKVTCPNCGTVKEISAFAWGTTICIACGTEYNI